MINLFFLFLVDSGKTGYVIDKKRIQKIREQYGKKYPDFLGKDEKKSYRSESIVGKLYRNALNYINGNIDELDTVFAQLNLDDNEQQLATENSSVREKRIRFSSRYFKYFRRQRISMINLSSYVNQ
jgi:hypothetical protein